MEYIFNTLDADFGYTLAIEPSKHKEDFKFGDKVRVVDGSYNFDAETGKHRHGIDDLFKSTAIVIETYCNKYYQWALGGQLRFVRTDLLLLFPKGEKVYTTSAMVLLETPELLKEAVK